MHETMQILVALLMVAVIIGGFWALGAAASGRQHHDIQEWATRNGYHLLKVKTRLVLLTPFRSDLQYQVWNALVYYVEVLTQEHRIRRAYVMIRGQMLSPEDDTCEVRWAN